MAMTMTISNNSSAKHITVQIPTSSGDAIEAWVYLPGGSGPHPAVVMAHGIGGIKAGGLAPFAERFREEGFAATPRDLDRNLVEYQKKQSVLPVLAMKVPIQMISLR